MKERTGIVTAHGKPLTLLGDEIKVGDMAPDFEALNNKLEPVKLSSLRGKIVVISAVTSLDTLTCDLETKRFNDEAKRLGDDIVVLTISMDLPFAQQRWGTEAGVTNTQLLSDHLEGSFGTSYGILIKSLRLLARTVFVIDKDGKVQYVQHVKENSEEPDYDDVLNAIARVVG